MTAPVREFSELDTFVMKQTQLLPGKDGYRQFGFVELLTPDGYNPKTKKGRARGYLHGDPALRAGGS
jgi:hypothetical protein